MEFVHVDPERLQVHWRIVGGPGHGRSGIDHYTVRDGCIVHQRVELTGSDF